MLWCGVVWCGVLWCVVVWCVVLFCVVLCCESSVRGDACCIFSCDVELVLRKGWEEERKRRSCNYVDSLQNTLLFQIISIVTNTRCKDANEANHPRLSRYLCETNCQGNVKNGNLNTSSFTVCARVIPFLSLDKSQQSGEFVATVAIENQNFENQNPKLKSNPKPNITVCTPKIDFRGQPKLETKAFEFDHVFGSESTNEQLAELRFTKILSIRRTLNGQVGVIFAYGQTGSGKTHSMNGVMDHLQQSSLLFNDRNGNDDTDTNGMSISFSYIEILGDYVNDCLGPNDSLHSSNKNPNEVVSIGEMMDGRLVVRNIASHVVHSSHELSHLVEQAKSLRSTAATSSRSHGIGIITCKDVQTGIEGSLYIVDLAGSERAADSKGHGWRN